MKEIKKIITAFNARIKTSPILFNIFSQFAGNRRYIYNQLLNTVKKANESKIYKINYYSTKIDKNTGDVETKLSSINLKSKKGLQKLLVTLQEDNTFLTLSHSQANQEASHALAKAFDMAYDHKFPKFS